MSIEVGSIVDGVVSGITNFGAFINLPENKVGLVHISEVADVYVKDVNDFLKEQDKVKVKILSVDDKGKIALSVKQAQEKKPEERPQQREQRPGTPWDASCRCRSCSRTCCSCTQCMDSATGRSQRCWTYRSPQPGSGWNAPGKI